MPIHRRRITAKGIRPKISSEIKGEYGYLLGMIEALTGQDLMRDVPDLDTAGREGFMDEFGTEGEGDRDSVRAEKDSARQR